MASNNDIVDDEDLIDLDGGVCVSRLFLQDNCLDEHEHLLDVCPPKLEQKLSLTKEQKHYHEHCNDENDDDDNNDDVLVTLGHDQVVPNLKRIDVVSSETIKRVKNITKNLEPFIGNIKLNDYIDNDNTIDKIDGIFNDDNDKDNGDDDDDTRETFSNVEQAISAFDFLADLDDNDDTTGQDLSDNKKLNNNNNDDDNKILSYPLEPKCFINNLNDKYKDIDKSNSTLDTCEYEPVIKKNNYTNEHDNFGFELSPPNKKQKIIDYHNFNIDDKLLRISFNKKSKKQNNIFDRKSWSEGATCHTDNYIDEIERSNSFDNDYQCQPSTSTGISTNQIGKSEVLSRSSSECSEVDWSWVEELEHQRSSVQRSTSDYLPHNNSPTVINQASKPSELSQFSLASTTTFTTSPAVKSTSNNNDNTTTLPPPPTTSTTTATTTINTQNNNNNQEVRMRSPSQFKTQTNASIVMSVDETVKSLSTYTTPSINTSDNINLQNNNYSNNNNEESNISSMTTTTTTIDTSSIQNEQLQCLNTQNITSTPGTSSWIRASMRRLRHLRLPDTELLQNQVTQQNSLPDIALIAPEILAAHTNGTTTTTILRPSSAPIVRNTTTIINTPRRGRRNNNNSNNNSNIQISRSTRNSVNSVNGDGDDSSVVINSASSVSPATRSLQHQTTVVNSTRRNCDRRREATPHENERTEEDEDDDDEDDEDDENNPLGRWPLPLNPTLACLGCTLGLFNISRFAILSVHFGANFIVQFIILSLILGIPLLTLQICLGQRLHSGAVDMWKISPIFHGVGIALLVAHAFIGIYSIIGISWMLVYFRDSFITKQDKYRWAEPFIGYRDDFKPMNNGITYKLHETVPDYFSGVVLQRHHLNDTNPGVVTIKFQVAFNLAVVWMIVFVSLSKGLKSYGKVIYGFTLFPILLILIFCVKIVSLIPTEPIVDLFPATEWHEFFISKDSWVSASSEVFLTWGLLGAASMQIAAHNKKKYLLQRDASLVIVLTFLVLLLAAFLANACVQILRIHGYIYTTSSFEQMSSYVFMRSVNQPAPPGQGGTPERFMKHASFIIGQRAIRPGADASVESGYQALRLSTELVPATLSILGTETISPFYAVIFYLALILFGIAQQLAIWHCVITGIMAINTKMIKLWETTITFFSCTCGCILGLPMATECGIYVVYYLDYTIGGGWWIMMLYLVQVGAVFVVRGRPHTGDTVVSELFPPNSGCLKNWAGPLLSFTWNVIMPITLVVLGCTLFKFGGFRDLYVYKKTRGEYWAVWARQLGAAIQLVPILLIPAVAIIQTCRYLNNGPPDIFDNEQMEVNCTYCEQCNANRIQMLYRPNLDSEETRHGTARYGNPTSTSIHGNGILPTTDIPFEDPPPKYTPPPSYTTATGARIAKMLRQSFRRSVRRIANVLGESSSVLPRTRPALQPPPPSSPPPPPPPPDYATVLVEMNQSVLSHDISINTIDQLQQQQPQQQLQLQQLRPDVIDTGTMTNVTSFGERHRPNTIDRMTRINTLDRCTIERTHSTIDRNRRYMTNGTSTLTAADVANLLRSSMRRGTSRKQQTIRNSIHNVPTTAASVENLVCAAAPINQDSLVIDKNSELVNEQSNDDRDDDDDKKTVEIDQYVI
ncbi:uncharacterized protein LOC122852579 isoform X1 [Aphidius gifuensis]|uniref:uncharacterized protein LOC122852579 isoform X1 n=1 Tax=Aphidius gifuensis TaxID=684658 RepID=UPI001CDD214F|nr:uncharacterized protein LOC122852579 isoform X1 [Aphidius gifuensis]XP_044008405.1 uncharacterized protein LOC122852579 isoform X1 [Aphidius gifuensis]